MSDIIIDTLNPPQQEAVKHIDGPLLVLAGAGSGKTRVITHRFANIIRERNLSTRNVVAVTFTNKAANEMKNRIAKLLNTEITPTWVRTFHSMGVLIIRRNPEVIDYPNNFIIYDDLDSKNVIKTIITEKKIPIGEYSPNSVYNAITSAKDDLILSTDFEASANTEFEKIVSDIYYEYEKTLFKNKALDFSDLILKPIIMFEKSPELLARYHQEWKYIMVDEFQDTNRTQYKLMNMMTPDTNNICVVGDDDQSIYSWRGARIDNIYDFEQQYNPKIIKLEQNYRSTKNILEAAHSIVTAIPDRMDKVLWTDRNDMEPIHLISAQSDLEEASYIAQKIRSLKGKYDYKDIAIFYRVNAKSRSLEEALLKWNIPYKIFGGHKFYERKEIKDIMSYLKLIINPFDRNSFDRIANVPKRGVGQVTKNRLTLYADTENITYIEAFLDADKVQGISGKVLEQVKDVGQILAELNQVADRLPPLDVIKLLIESINYQEYIVSYDEEGTDRWENVKELVNSVAVFHTDHPELNIIDFINEITLQTSIDSMEEMEERDYVSLMTIHNSKGLEFAVVFVSGVEDGMIPHSFSVNSSRGLMEERRLFYVAMTRAKDQLYLLHSESSFRYGSRVTSSPSRYLEDLPKNLLKQEFAGLSPHKTISHKRIKSSKKNEDISSIYADEKKIDNDLKTVKIEDISTIIKGDKVHHQTFGLGEVDFVSDRMMIVKFKKFGTQILSGNFRLNLSKVLD